MKPDYIAIGARLQEARKISKITQQELADYMGVSVSYIKNTERGGKPSIKYLLAVSEKCNVLIDWLLTGVYKNNEGNLKARPIKQMGEVITDPDLNEMIDIVKHIMDTDDNEQRIWAKIQLKRTFAEFYTNTQENKKHS